MLKRDGMFLSLDEALTVGWSLHCPQAALWWHSGVVPEERTGLHQELLWLEEPGNGDDDIPLGDTALEPPVPFPENDDAVRRDARGTWEKRKDPTGRQRPGFSPARQGTQGSQVSQAPENARPFILRVAAPWPPLFVWVGAALALLRERNMPKGILDTEQGPLLVRRTAAADARMEAQHRRDGSPVAPSARRCRRCPWDEWCPALLKEGWNDANGS